MKKIAVVDLLFNWPPDGGARTDVKELITRLKIDFDVCLFVPDMDYCFPRGKNAEKIGVKTVKIRTDILEFNYFSFSHKLKIEIEKFTPDIIFFTDGWYLKHSLITHFINYKYIIRFYAYEGLCLRQHGTFFVNNKICEKNYLTGDFKDWLHCELCAMKWLLETRNRLFFQEFITSLSFLPFQKNKVIQSISNASAIICYNSFIKEKLDVFNKNTHILPSGINISNFSPSANKKNNFQFLNEINLLMCGRIMDPAKGFLTLKNAFYQLKKTYKNLKLHITTERDYHDKDNDIISHHWSSQEKLNELYSSAHICIVPSIWPEPFGIVTLEAMAAGIPVVVSDVIGPASVITHNYDGLIFKAGDSEDLAEKIASLLQSAELYNTVKKNAAGSVQKYEWDKIYIHLSEILKNIF